MNNSLISSLSPQDRHTTGYLEPAVDSSQDWLLVHAEDNQAGTTIKTVRRLDTQDTDDVTIKVGQQKSICFPFVYSIFIMICFLIFYIFSMNLNSQSCLVMIVYFSLNFSEFLY